MAALAALAVDPAPAPFAVICRGGCRVDVLIGGPGDVVDVPALAELPLPGPGQPPVLALVPFRQVAELGFAHHDDGAPLRCLRARHHLVADRSHLLGALPDQDVPLTGVAFDVDDDSYAQTVKRVIEEEIGRGEGANFVIRRDLRARQPLPPARAALAVLRRLLERESGAYWAYAVHLPAPTTAEGEAKGAAADLTLVGATPERHVSARAGEVVMNPISGTFRHPEGGPTRDGLLGFLRDTKEVEELFMVVDEELKMMSRLCERGGRVIGPYLKPMRHLTHTEYLLTGYSDADPRDVLRETMFAATVTGSPLENACRVITRHEATGRGHYSGMAALLAHGAAGPELDAPILIRTAYLGADGEVRIPVGATLVRHSIPEHEVAETHAKVAGLLSAFATSTPGPAPTTAPTTAPAGPVPDLTADPQVRAALAARNQRLARFWLDEQADQARPKLLGRCALIVDAEDAWTAMLAHVLRRLGMTAGITGWGAVTTGQIETTDLLVAGPGPGDPRDLADPRITAVHALVQARRVTGRPLLAVCLSHQILATALGLPVTPLARPHQGTQRRVRAFGRDVRVGFYNTYTARLRPGSHGPAGVEVFADGPDGEVVAVRGPGFASVQFHLESVLSPDGVTLLGDLAEELLRNPAAGPDQG
jgi:phenazine biosynthesis protein phzE